jgi:hypothetical protein
LTPVGDSLVVFGVAVEEIEFDSASEFGASDAGVDGVFGRKVVKPVPGGNIRGVKGLVRQGYEQFSVSGESVNAEYYRTRSDWSREEAEKGIRYSETSDFAERRECAVRGLE